MTLRDAPDSRIGAHSIVISKTTSAGEIELDGRTLALSRVPQWKPMSLVRSNRSKSSGVFVVWYARMPECERAEVFMAWVDVDEAMSSESAKSRASGRLRVSLAATSPVRVRSVVSAFDARYA